MNAVTKDETDALKPTGLALLREAVPEHLISPLPKGTKAQNECPNEQKISCRVCGGWHHPQVRHLDYVGHAAATHLLLEADEKWTWEPLAFTDQGLPRFHPVRDSGMTLRDYFAAKAMASLVNNPELTGRSMGDIDPGAAPLLLAQMAYVFADAMLKARDA